MSSSQVGPSRRPNSRRKTKTQVAEPVEESESTEEGPSVDSQEVVPAVDVLSRLEAKERTLLAEWFSGPFPPPDMLMEYNKTVPNGDFAERLLRLREQEQAMVADEAAHRRDQEKRALDASIWQAKGGTFVGLLIVLCLIGLAIYATYEKEQAVAIAALGLDIGYVVSVFIAGGNLQVKERLKKMRILAGQNPDMEAKDE